MNDSTKTQIHHLLKEATVKIYADGQFQGSGFFVTSNGYLVTAYHCVAKSAMLDAFGKPLPQELYQTLEVETSPKVRRSAEVDKDKSLPELDIAVLKVSHYEPTVCLPVGRLSEQWEGDEIVGCGCPGGDKPGMAKIGTYSGVFTRILTDDNEFIEIQGAIQGGGQSGGVIYHYGSQRVIAITEGFRKDTNLLNVAIAVRLDKLLEKWQTLAGQTVLVAKQWNARLQQPVTQAIPPSPPPYRMLTVLGMVFIIAMSGVAFWAFGPQKPGPKLEEPKKSELPSSISVSQVVPSTTIPMPMPVPVKKLSMSNVDGIENDVYVINFTPPGTVRSVRLNNPNSTSVQISLIGFPEQFFYTNLMDDSSLIEASTERDLRLVFKHDIPDKNEYLFQIADNNNNSIRLRIHLQLDDWRSYIEQKLNLVAQKISALPSRTPMKVYEVAKQTTAEEYKELSPGLQDAFTGQRLTQVNEPDAAAFAYAKAEQTEPKIVERMVTTTPIIVALAQTHYDNQDYGKAASWYNIAATQGDAKAQYALGELYETGKGVEKNTETARELFKKATEQGDSEALTKMEQLFVGKKPPETKPTSPGVGDIEQPPPYIPASDSSLYYSDCVGYIESFDCPPEQYKLTRAKPPQPEPVQFLTRLYPGDTILLTQRNCQMTLRIGEVNIIQLNDRHLHYDVPTAGHYPTLSSNLFNLIREGLHYLLYGQATTPQAHTVITRGNENKVQNLVIPQMQEEQAKLVAGDRDLFLMWEGGLPPYRVRLYLGNNKKPQLERTGLPNRQVRFEQLHLTVGQHYHVQIRSTSPYCPQQSDDEQCLTKKKFQVVDAKQLPAMPVALAQSSLFTDLKQTLFAVWLLDPKNQFKITWGLEAYQRVAAGEDEFSIWIATATKGKW